MATSLVVENVSNFAAAAQQFRDELPGGEEIHRLAKREWSPLSPVEPGLYLYADREEGSEPTLVYVAMGDQQAGEDPLSLYADGKWISQLRGRWYGPVPMPPDAAVRILQLPGEPRFLVLHRPASLTTMQWERLVAYLDDHHRIDSALATEESCVVKQLLTVSQEETMATMREAVVLAAATAKAAGA